jgi:hypothetical protein
LKAALGITVLWLMPEPDAFWQLVQWQAIMFCTGWLISYRILPQRHPPVIDSAIFNLLYRVADALRLSIFGKIKA